MKKMMIQKKRVPKFILGLSIFTFIMIFIMPVNVFADNKKAQSQECKDWKAQAKEEEFFLSRYNFEISPITGTNNFKLTVEVGKNDKSLKNIKKKIKFKVVKIRVYNTTDNTSVVNTADAAKISDYIDSEDKSLTISHSLTIKGNNFVGDARRLEVTIESDGFNDPDQEKNCGKDVMFRMTDMKDAFGNDSDYSALEDENHDTLDTFNLTTNAIDCSTAQTDAWKKKWCELKGMEASNNSSTTVTTSEREFDFSAKGKFTDDPVGLKCDYNKFVPQGATGDSYYVNKEKLTGTRIEKKTVSNYTYHCDEGVKEKEASCKIKCEEQVEVEYGPPIASKAGFCFEYKVRVTSMANCEIYEKPKKPKVNKKTCTPKPSCKGARQYFTQAGPDEDFDACIVKCDGGKYTSKCSKKCYKEVYGTEVSTQTSELDISYVNKLVSPNSDTKVFRIANKKGEKVDTTPRYGYNDSGEYVWMPYGVPIETFAKRNCDPTPGYKKCATDPPYYHTHSWGCSGSSYKYYNKWGIPTSVTTAARSKYVADFDGVTVCAEKCTWTKCTDGKNSNTDTASSEPTSPDVPIDCTYTDSAQADADKAENEARSEELKAICEAGASCTTTTTTFTISVDYVNGSNKKITIEFPYSTSSDEPGTTNGKNTDSLRSQGGKNAVANEKLPDSNNPTLLSYAGCYSSDVKDVTYQAEWSFPGTWVNIKNGDLSFKPVTGGGWDTKNHMFCSPKDTRDVNTKWWATYYYKLYGNNKGYSYNNPTDIKYYQSRCANHTCYTTSGGSKGDGTCNAQTTFGSDDAKNLVWNIRATTRDFGYFDWDIDVECFYSFFREYELCNDVDNPGKENADSDGDDTGKTCKSGDSGYEVRPVDLGNLFPSEEVPKLPSPEKTGRTPPFNWSKFASQTNKDVQFKSTPSEYACIVQKVNYDIYSDRYLDYEIIISKDSIKSIKNPDRNYSSWQGKTTVDSVSHYQSDLLRSSGSIDAKSKLPSVSALKCNNMKNYSSNECEDISDCSKFVKGGK